MPRILTANSIVSPTVLSVRLPYAAEFRRDDPADNLPSIPDSDEISEGFAGIRCPICKWRPSRASLWTCWDCDYPEYFYDGCGTSWNTFETKGLCPTCAHRWVWTTCHSCFGWSRHLDWYEGESSGKT